MKTNLKFLILEIIAEALCFRLLDCNSTRRAMSKKGDGLRHKAEELRTNAELAATTGELADQWDAIDLTITGGPWDGVAAK
jgi:hypothetical protein